MIPAEHVGECIIAVRLGVLCIMIYEKPAIIDGHGHKIIC
jgi:hypothetical protein